MTSDFYAAIPAVDGFEELSEPGAYRPAPDDWWIACADIAGSTRAITEGKYKAVNTVGVAAIAALRNVAKPHDVPYVFGGDGAVVLLPAHLVDRARTALAGTVAMAARGFGLELRAAVVPVSYARDVSTDILVARQRVSSDYVQAALFGGGAEWVEEQLKSGTLPEDFLVHADPDADPDYRGLECRWKEIPSPADETVAVIVETTRTADDPLALFRSVMTRTREIYGDDSQCRPVTAAGLAVALVGREQRHEATVKGWRLGMVQRWGRAARQRAVVAFGWLLMVFGVRVGDFDWPSYQTELVANTDFRKFDGALRFVLSGSAAQRAALEGYLSELADRGFVRFGVHVARGALMTCLIDQRQGAHFHFVDAAGGGYAAAAAALKGQHRPTE
ncbi:MAG: DUF3095 domain-containing protein [Gemmatimonadota bacterium]